MATATLLLYQNKNFKKKSLNINNETYPVAIRVSHLSKNKYIETGYHLKLKDWNEKSKQVKSSFPNSGRANAKISSMFTKALDVIALPKANLKKMTVYQLAELIESLTNKSFTTELKSDNLEHVIGTAFESYARKVERRYRQAEKYGSADKIAAAISTTLSFTNKPSLLLSEITETFLDDFETWWLGKGNNINGLGSLLRMIRRIFNVAIKDKDTELTTEHYPFGLHGYSIKKEKTEKRAIKEEYIQKIREVKYQPYSKIWHDKNYFLFSFNLHGMNFTDLVKLTISNLIKDDQGQFERLKYQRQKTKRGQNVKVFNIKLTEEAKAILKLYTVDKKASDLIFPVMQDIINCGNNTKIYAYKINQLALHNYRLSKIAKNIGLDGKLTSYVARHTFATIGLYKGVSKTEIGAMMGHTSAVTTEAYFDEFEHDVLDNAADAIFN